jgi:hypothetical protein
MQTWLPGHRSLLPIDVPDELPQHDERFGDRVEDRFRALAFVDGLIDA